MLVPPYSMFIYGIILVLLFLLNFLIVLTNTAFNNVNVNKISQLAVEQDKKSALRVINVLEAPTKYKYANKLFNYIFVMLSFIICSLLPYNTYISLIIYFIILASVGELMPRKIAIMHSEKICLLMSSPQRMVIAVAMPLVFIMTLITDVILKIFRQETKIEISRYSEDQILSILEEGKQRGELKEEGKKMINSIFAFDDELAYEIMTPRTDVFIIDLNDPPEKYLDTLLELRYSRIPVCENDSDNIIGILNIKDYLIKARTSGFENVDIKSILRTPYFIPETKNIDSLFFELQKERQHIAILIDEYGGFSGIVTMEDIIEEVMGEIDDEYDQAETGIKKIDDNTYIVNGKVYLSDLYDDFNIKLESENSETIGGFIIDLLGEIPGENDTNRIVSYENFIFTILSVKERRIESLKIKILNSEEQDNTNGEN